MTVKSAKQGLAYVRQNLALTVILVSAAIVWIWIFTVAAIDFVSDGERPFRAVWNGFGQIELFGFTFHFNFEGWADHDYFYHNWADQFLSGELPYTAEFDTITIDSQTWNVPYFFPPLYLYICVIGKVLHPDVGIGAVLCVFGFLTAFPVYGIGKYLSGTKQVGELAAATYLFNPIVLYYTAFEWLNPAPFVFFAMLSFYLLTKDYRIAGAIAMTMSALCKQTAFFFALPLIAYLLRKPPRPNQEGPERIDDGDDAGERDGDKLDLTGFAKIAIVVLMYAGLVSLPYLLDPANYAFQILQRAGATRLKDFVSVPAGNAPISVAVIFVVLGIIVQGTPYDWLAPSFQWLAHVTDLLTYYSICLLLGLALIFVLMLVEPKDDRNLRAYWRRLFYLSLLLMLWVHIFSPRGIYKYYTVVLVPFFSILSVSAMCKRETEEVKMSLPMLILPFILAITIMIPDRNVYILYLVLMALGYILHKAFSETYAMVAQPVRRLLSRIRRSRRIAPNEDKDVIEETESTSS
ncbi:MAG: hypothetical protein ACFFAY_10360 [Promethearchaeota archaeon]